MGMVCGNAARCIATEVAPTKPVDRDGFSARFSHLSRLKSLLQNPSVVMVLVLDSATYRD